ncbi:UbiX family flavin prenyltransferase [Botrimarina hoheduenensis]|uniref:Flavin prenyltransferase UbiX n=1 Tax=Botrimarina hoheduenensis TaxID=2528000 RepID=A0A5C5W025_9BACT|nr:flavin prenyltransferase UbiX [Botrimarina hoheduenensis]TWT43371.1 putative aromatic acid decarboxylase [Botrimarina hoheduenensis]
MTSPPILVGVTGASGAVYTVRLLDVLLRTGHEVHVSISPSGAAVIEQELGLKIDLKAFDPAALGLLGTTAELLRKVPLLTGAKPVAEADAPGKLRYCYYQDFMAPMASGSFLNAGMALCPCSGTTLSAIAAGAAGNLIQRAAEVQLKERRPLVLVPRETPVSLTHIDNMRRATEAGAIVLPAAPGWYHGVQSLADLVDFVVARVCDQLGVRNALIQRWGEEEAPRR